MSDVVMPRAINHIGVAVSDIQAAIKWYSEIIGFRLIAGPWEVRHDSPRGPQAIDVLGPKFRSMLQCHMTSANGVGFELFQSIDPPHVRRSEDVEFWRNGFFHICLTDPDIDGLTARIVAGGGRQISKIWKDRPEFPDYRMVYCLDPFGNVLEIYTHSYELMQGHK